jgi:hypothetical protein
MAKLTISDAARTCRVARSTLPRAINAGRLSLDADHRVDTAELLRAGYTLQAARQEQPAASLRDTAERANGTRQGDAAPLHHELTLLQREFALLERERDLLRTALDAAAAREQVALEREARLLHLLEQAQTQSHRLLDTARPPAAPSPAARHASRQTVLREPRPTPSSVHSAPPPCDPHKHVLGKLCPRGHDYQDTGQSLLQRSNRKCLVCHREQAQARRQARRTGQREP